MENKLTLEHLSPYLPYGLMFYNTVLHSSKMLKQINIRSDGTVYIRISDGKLSIENTINDIDKPILRPLSDLTKEIEHIGERFVPKELLIDRYDLKFDENDDFFLDYYCIGDTDSPWTGYHIIQFLIQWHFDVFGLIEKGLAVDINTIK